jgi:hypothetical protein
MYNQDFTYAATLKLSRPIVKPVPNTCANSSLSSQ